jgi:uncharacterized protein YjbI with pentapeptide repeats
MEDTVGQPRSEDVISIEKLQASVDAAATQVGHLYITFLLFGLYLAITVGATTHEQLLRSAPVELPLLDVAIPLFAFYWIAPALFVLMHFNLLLQLHVLAQKLWQLDLAIERWIPLASARGVQRRLLPAFAFSQMLIGHHHRLFIRSLYRVMIWTTVIVLPILLLLGVQARFLPYHDVWTTMWHRVLVALDAILIVVLWLRVIWGRDARAVQTLRRERSDARTRREIIVAARRLGRDLRNIVAWSLIAVAGLGSVLAFLFVFTFPGDPDPRIGDPMEETLIGWFVPQRASSNSGFILSLMRAPFANPQPTPGNIGSRALEFFQGSLLISAAPGLFAQNLAVPEAREIKAVPTKEQIAQFGEEAAWQAFGGPISLRRRDLRDSNLSRSTLAHADFRLAYLQGANLEDANLQGANFQDADLQGAMFFDSFGADLRDAHLPGVNLQGASLIVANLQGADLTGASLQGAHLFRADLQGADLTNADLRNANLDLANLQGATLTGANLQGADLGRAKLQGADLTGAYLRASDLQRAELWFAKLGFGAGRAQLWSYADLRGAAVDPASEGELDL